MIKLNRTTEYGLIALRHIGRKPLTITSAREVADCYGLPFEITAKTLQKLRDSGLIQSAQGARGGYTLQRSLQDVTLAQFLELMEGPQSVVACSSAENSNSENQLAPELVQITSTAPSSEGPGGSTCGYHGKCEIRGVMNDLNHRVLKFLSNISLAELASSPVLPSAAGGFEIGAETSRKVQQETS